MKKLWMSHTRLSVALLAIFAIATAGAIGVMAQSKSAKPADASEKGEAEHEDGDENEVTVTIDQLPAAAAAALNQAAQGGTISEIESETEDGATTYEADIVQGGVKTEVKISADGKLLKSEKDDDNDNEHEDKD